MAGSSDGSGSEDEDDGSTTDAAPESARGEYVKVRLIVLHSVLQGVLHTYGMLMHQDKPLLLHLDVSAYYP
jgi:hypothetical protein